MRWCANRPIIVEALKIYMAHQIIGSYKIHRIIDFYVPPVYRFL